MSVRLSDAKSKLIVLSLVWPNDIRINQVVSVGLGGSLLQSGSWKGRCVKVIEGLFENIFPSTSPRAGRARHHIKECGLVNKPEDNTAFVF